VVVGVVEGGYRVDEVGVVEGGYRVDVVVVGVSFFVW